MARNSADVVEHDDAIMSANDQDAEDAEALAAIHQSWLDESERTDVLEPHHLIPRLRKQTEVQPEPADADEWEEAKTQYFERTASVELLDSTFVNEYKTDRLHGELGQLVVRQPEELAPEHPEAIDGPSVVDDGEDPQWASLSEPSYESGPRLREDPTNELDLKDVSIETAPGGRRKSSKHASVRTTSAQRFAVVPSQPTAAQAPAWHAQRASAVPPARTSSVPGSRPAPRASVPPLSRQSAAPAAPLRQSQPPAFRQSVAPVPHETASMRPIGMRSSRPSHPGALPLAAELDSDIAELAGRRNGRGATWIWLTASAACGAGLIFLVHSWNTAQSPIVQAPPSAATETTVNAAAQQTETGLSITSVPEGAQIFVDGKATGFLTPANVRRLAPGLHSVELKLAGYYDTSLAAALQANATLDMASVSLRRHESVDATATPVAELAAAVGAIVPKLKAAKTHISWRERVAARRAARKAAVTRNAPVRGLDDATNDDDDEESVSVASGTGTLRINSRPWAAVMIDNMFVGNTPQRSLRVKAGEHEVKLVNEPLNMSKRFHVKVHEGETVTRVELLNDDAEDSHASRPSSGDAYAQAD